jgi:hypothetical protein
LGIVFEFRGHAPLRRGSLAASRRVATPSWEISKRRAPDPTLGTVMFFRQPAMRSLQDQKLRTAPDLLKTSKISAVRGTQSSLTAASSSPGRATGSRASTPRREPVLVRRRRDWSLIGARERIRDGTTPVRAARARRSLLHLAVLTV